MIDLTALPLMAAPPQLLDFGGDLVPVMGGAEQRLNRLGMRWQVACETPDMPTRDAREWTVRIAAGKVEGVSVAIHEPDLDPVDYGTPAVAAAVAGGTTLPLKGLAAGAAIAAGKWLSILHGGRRYLHMAREAVVAGNDGTAAVAIFPLLRTRLIANDVVELAQPILDGRIDGPVGWPNDRDEVVRFTFTARETR